MKKFLDSFYLKKTTFVLSVIIACIGWIGWAVNEGMAGQYTWCLYAILYAILIVLLFLAYKRGETNLQKALLGGLLICMLVMYTEPLAYNLSNNNIPAIIYYGVGSVLSLIVLIAHMRQQLDHTGSLPSVVVSQCSGLLVVTLLIWVIYLGVKGELTSFELFWAICISATVVFIISIETRIKEYKKIRAEKRAAGAWTEEERQKAKVLFKI